LAIGNCREPRWRRPAGQEAIWQLKSSGLDTSHIQIDSAHATGTVLVQVDSKGQAEYKFCEDVAWDHLAWTLEWQELAIAADAVCFGSLAQRSETSRLTIRKVLQSVRADAARIFDVNLRQAFLLGGDSASSALARKHHEG